jgi:hypothetical protein
VWRSNTRRGVLVQREMELVLIVAIPFEWNLKQKQVNDPEGPVPLAFWDFSHGANPEGKECADP